MASVSPSERRLQKELMSLIKEPRPGVQVDTDSVGQNLTQWKIHMAGVPGTLYDGENFQLLFKFNNKYPFDSPEVTFVGPNIPIHPHIYSNGHICLSILTEDWTPALSVQSVCLSISSMLSSCREKKRPADNTLYVKTCNKNPKKTKWWYHVACETSGIIGSVGLALLKKIGSMIARVTHEKRATTYLLQRIAVAIQRGNVASIMGTIPPSKNLGEIFYL